MKLKVLGTQSPYNTPGHNSPGFLITSQKDKILLDCGSGSHSLLNLPSDLKNLRVILTHLHRDHYNDIFNLQYASFVFWNQGRLKKPITVFLPKFPENIYADIRNEPNAYAQYFTLLSGMALHIGNMRVRFLRTDHSFAADTYAVAIDSGKSKIVYTSDTSFSSKAELVEFAREADLLICESSLLKRHGFSEINPHLTAEQAAIIAREANVSKLMLTHFWPEEPVEEYLNEAKTVFSNVIAANENDEYTFAE